MHSRLEALQIQLAEKSHSSSGLSSGTAGPGSLSDADLQKWVQYLRRKKNIASSISKLCIVHMYILNHS